MRLVQRAGRWLAITAVVGAAGITAGSGVASARPAEQAAQAVSIVDFAFQPGSMTVPVGTRVTWTNTGQAPHTTSADGGAWDSGRLAPAGTFSFTFSTAGTFAYHCNVHPSMVASVVVQAAAAGAAPAPAAQATQAPAAAAAPAPAAPAPPRTGTGSSGDANLNSWWLLMTAAGAVFATSAFGVRLVSRRVRSDR